MNNNTCNTETIAAKGQNCKHMNCCWSTLFVAICWIFLYIF